MILKYMENFLTTELVLSDGMSLQIQGAHRAVPQRLGPDAIPLSIVIDFEQYDVKETVWKKKIILHNKLIFFDHDYAHDFDGKTQSPWGNLKSAER